MIFSGKGINGLNFNNGLADAGEGTTANEPRPQSQPERMLRLLNLPVQTFTRDAAPVVDDTDPAGKLNII